MLDILNEILYEKHATYTQIFFLDRFYAPNAIITFITTTIFRKNFKWLFYNVNINK